MNQKLYNLDTVPTHRGQPLNVPFGEITDPGDRLVLSIFGPLWDVSIYYLGTLIDVITVATDHAIDAINFAETLTPQKPIDPHIYTDKDGVEHLIAPGFRGYCFEARSL